MGKLFFNWLTRAVLPTCDMTVEIELKDNKRSKQNRTVQISDL